MLTQHSQDLTQKRLLIHDESEMHKFKLVNSKASTRLALAGDLCLIRAPYTNAQIRCATQYLVVSKLGSSYTDN